MPAFQNVYKKNHFHKCQTYSGCHIIFNKFASRMAKIPEFVCHLHAQSCSKAKRLMPASQVTWKRSSVRQTVWPWAKCWGNRNQEAGHRTWDPNPGPLSSHSYRWETVKKMHLVFICGGNNFLKLWIHILPGCSKLPLLARLTLHKKKKSNRAAGGEKRRVLWVAEK